MPELPILPDPDDPRLTRPVEAVDQHGQVQQIRVVEERPLTIYLNSQEIVTAMTIGDHPEFLAVGYLRNQGMLLDSDEITGVSFDDEVEAVVVRTAVRRLVTALVARSPPPPPPAASPRSVLLVLLDRAPAP